MKSLGGECPPSWAQQVHPWVKYHLLNLEWKGGGAIINSPGRGLHFFSNSGNSIPVLPTFVHLVITLH